MDHCTLHTALGDLTGILKDGAELYKGIPFATAGRFEYPEMVHSWEGVHDGTKDEINCPQYGAYLNEAEKPQPFFYQEFREGHTFAYDENPITLNLVRPKDAQNCPVLVYVHGGGFETGTVGELPYGTSSEYAKRGIILVSLGHRLNVFSLYRSRNYGLYDILTGIEWVRKYIREFGGDPEQITLMGQSAGAMSINDLMYTKTLEGKIKGVVLMSGAGTIPGILGPRTAAQSAAFWDRVTKDAGASNEAELKEVPAEKLWKAWYNASRDPYDYRLMQPGIDGVIIPKNPDKIKTEEMLDVPMIFGFTSQDFMAYFMWYAGFKTATERQKKNMKPVWGYFFDKALPGNRFRSFHSSDLWYMFGNMDQSWRPFDQSDYDLSREMADYVANFVKTQNPNAMGMEPWAPVSREKPMVRYFDGDKGGMISRRLALKRVHDVTRAEKGPM